MLTERYRPRQAQPNVTFPRPAGRSVYSVRVSKRPANALAANVRRLRESLGLTQARLADEAGVSSVGMIEAGKRPNARRATVAKIAAALGVSEDELYRGANPDTVEAPPALATFLRSPGGVDVTDEERLALLRLRARGKRPNEETYYWALKMLRSMNKEGEGG